MRRVDDEAIDTHAAIRFRSEYHYAKFEYWRSAKLIAFLDGTGVDLSGRVLDDGCGGGGMCVSFAEESTSVFGIDLADRFREAGTTLAQEKDVSGTHFAQADATKLPFRDAAFDLVLSHSVIEHVADPASYLHEARRVLRDNGAMFLQTAPYLSPSGSHLPRLKVPIPLYLLIGRRGTFAFSKWLALHAPHWIDAPPEGSSFLTNARDGTVKLDDLLYPVTVRNLRDHIRRAGFKVAREDLHISRLARRLFPEWVIEHVPKVPLVCDILVTNMEYVLTPTR